MGNGIDAGSVHSEVRIRLDKLNADIKSAGTALDNLGDEFTRGADQYSNVAGKKYKAALESIAAEQKRVVSAALSGALNEEEAIERLISLRKEEIKILQDRAVKDGQASAETVVAINKSEAALAELEKRQAEIAAGGEQASKSLIDYFRNLQAVMQGPVQIAKDVIRVIKQIAQAVGEMEDAWAKQAASSAKLGSVYKSVGAEAWTTLAHLEDLAQGIAKVTNYEDDEIESMEAVLLGFRNIQGVNFDRAVQSILDMATVMGGSSGEMSLVSAAQAVGKALDDPVTGMDSLTRQGFKFTEQEKEVIKQLVESGQKAKAQKIILDELTKTFGGASEEVAKYGAGLRELKDKSIGELKEAMGGAISEGGFMTKWRQAIIDIADALTTAINRHNQYRQAVRNTKSEEGGTLEDQLTIAKTDVEFYTNIVKGYTSAGGMWVKADTAVNRGILAAAQMQVKEIENQIKVRDSLTKALNSGSKNNAPKTQAEETFGNERLQILTEYQNELKRIGLLKLDDIDSTKLMASAADNAVNRMSQLAVSYSKFWGKDNQGILDGLINDARSYSKTLKDLTASAEAVSKAQDTDNKRWEAAARGYTRVAAAAEKAAQAQSDVDAAAVSGQAGDQAYQERIAAMEKANALQVEGLREGVRLLEESAAITAAADEQAYQDRIAAMEKANAAQTEGLREGVRLLEQKEAEATEIQRAGDEQRLQDKIAAMQAENAAQLDGLREGVRLIEESAIVTAAAEDQAFQDRIAAMEKENAAQADGLREGVARLEEAAAYESSLSEQLHQDKIATMEAETAAQIAGLNEGVERIKKRDETYKAMEKDLTDAINGEQDVRRKAMLQSLLEQLTAAKAAGTDQEEIQKQLTKTITDFDIAAEIKKQYREIVIAANYSVDQQIEYFEFLKTKVAQNSDEWKMLQAIIDQLNLNKAKSEFEKFADTANTIVDALQDAIGNFVDAFTASIDSQVAALDAYYEHQRELIENDGMTREEYLKKQVADAKAAGDQEEIAAAEKALALFKLDEEYDAKKAALQYQAEIREWQWSKMSALVDAAQAIVKIWSNNPNPVIAGVLTGITVAATGAQIAAIDAAKPTLDTGGIVLSGERSAAQVQVGAGTGEIMFGTSAMGSPLMEAFMEGVADKVMSRMAGVLVTIPLTLDGKVIAQSTVKLIDDGQVRFKKASR